MRTSLKWLALSWLVSWAGSGLAGGVFSIATTPEPEVSVSIAFDGTNYLVGISAQLNGVVAQLVSPSGGLVGGVISTGGIGTAPYVAFGAGNHLMVWGQGEPLGGEIMGRFISPAGAPVGPSFTIEADALEGLMGVGFGGSTFLVVYAKETDPVTFDSRVLGRLVGTDGSVGDEIEISSGPGDHAINNVAFGGGRFLVVWVNDDTDAEVLGRFVGPDGTLDDEFTINASPAVSDGGASLLFAGGQFLVAFSDVVVEEPEDFDVFGQRLDLSGAPLGGPFPISTAPGNQAIPLLASNGRTVLATWTDLRSGVEVYGRFLDMSGAAIGDEFPISPGGGDFLISPVASDGTDYLVAFAEGVFPVGGDVFGRIVTESMTTDATPVPPPPGTSPGDNFGAALDLDGSVMVIGVPGSDAAGTDAGAVAVYRVEGGNSVLEQMLQVPPGFVAEGFGSSVAVSGDTLVVGTGGAPANKGSLDALAAAVFQRLSDGSWDFKQPLAGSGASGDDGFGTAVDISDDMIVVGAPDDDEDEPPGQGGGAAYVFERDSGQADFEQMAKLKKPTAAPGGKFGQAVAVSGATIGVGAPKDKPFGGLATGSAELYQAIANAVNRLGTATGSDADDGSNFGASIGVGGDGTVVVGSPDEDDEDADQGAAYVFDTAGGMIAQTSRLQPSDASSGARFGAAVAIDGNTIAVGSPTAPNDGVDSGAVYRFGRSGDSVTQVSRQGADASQSGLGAAVAVSAGRILSGAPDSQAATGAAALQLASAQVSAAVSGPWFNAAQSGHGWLIELLAGVGPSDPDRINAYWYVYLNGLPVWLIGTGDVSGGGATLDVVMTEGADFPPAFDSADVELIPWGTLRFDFDGDTAGTASWNSVLPEFGSGSLDMVRLAPIASSAASCRSGSYFNSSQSGHGFVVEVVNIGGEDQVILAWYVYLDGAQVWLFGQGPLVGDTAEVPMSVFSGADFPPDFDPADVVGPAWGTVTIEFTGPHSATIDWDAETAGYTDGSLDVTRLTELAGHACP